MSLFYLYTGMYLSCIIEGYASINCFVGSLTDLVTFEFPGLLAAALDCVYLTSFLRFSHEFQLT
jgi:hypothetical protein